MNPVQSIFRSIEQDSINNILTICTHERYEQGLCKIPNTNFYSIWKEGNKKWNETYGKCPPNYHLMYNRPNQLPLWLDFDFAIAQNVFGQYQTLLPLVSKMQIPMIRIEHTTWMNYWGPDHKRRLDTMRCNANVFITNHSVKAWGFEDQKDTFVIDHTVDTDLFTPKEELKENRIFTVANDFINRDNVLGFKLFQRVTQGLPVCVAGATPGLSEAASCVEDLVREYQKSSIYLNTAHLSPIPTSMLEAMSCGSCPISVATCGIPEYIKDGENGMLATSEQELRDKLELALREPNLAYDLGQKARETVLEKCNINRFISQWEEVFDYVKLR